MHANKNQSWLFRFSSILNEQLVEMFKTTVWDTVESIVLGHLANGSIFSMPGVTAYSSVEIIISSRINCDTLQRKFLSLLVLIQRGSYNQAPELKTPVSACVPDSQLPAAPRAGVTEETWPLLTAWNSHWTDRRTSVSFSWHRGGQVVAPWCRV